MPHQYKQQTCFPLHTPNAPLLAIGFLVSVISLFVPLHHLQQNSPSPYMIASLICLHAHHTYSLSPPSLSHHPGDISSLAYWTTSIDSTAQPSMANCLRSHSNQRRKTKIRNLSSGNLKSPKRRYTIAKCGDITRPGC